MEKIVIKERKNFKDLIYLRFKKIDDFEMFICPLVYALGFDEKGVEEFHYYYGDLNDSHFCAENDNYRIDLIATEKSIHLLVRLKSNNLREFETKLKNTLKEEEKRK